MLTEEPLFWQLIREAIEQDQCQLVFDIETAPLPDDILFRGFDESKVNLPEHPGVFDPGSVKTGNITDPIKKAKKLREKEIEHTQLVGSYDARCKIAIKEAKDKLREKAPLDARYGQIVAIGYGLRSKDGCCVYSDIDEEAVLLSRFTAVFDSLESEYQFDMGIPRLISWNGNKFDLPFIQRRCWATRIDFNRLIFKYGGIANNWYVDAHDVWNCNDRHAYTSLDSVAAALGVTRKLEGVTGDQFWQLLKTDPKKAEEYLEHDIKATYEVAERLNLIEEL